jgi:ribosomal protein L36
MTRFGLTLYCSDCALVTVHGVSRKVCAARPNRKQKSEVTPDTTP